MLAHFAHMLEVSVTDPDTPDYPGIPDGADGWRLDPVIPDLLPQAASSRCQDPGLAPRKYLVKRAGSRAIVAAALPPRTA